MKFVHRDKPRNWNPKIDVVSCICWWDNKILCLLRNPDKREGNKWGFPAGKLEENENKEAAVRREIKEELNLVLPEIRYIQSFYVRYPTLDFTYSVFESIFNTPPHIEINKQEHADYDWMTVEDIQKEDVVNGNKEIVQILYSTDGSV